MTLGTTLGGQPLAAPSDAARLNKAVAGRLPGRLVVQAVHAGRPP